MNLLYNARIYTLDPARPITSAILIDRDRILAVGEKNELPGADESFDMRGRILLPGLTDAHLHLQYYSLGLQKIDCETEALAECLRRVSARMSAAKPAEWIFGHGWNQNQWASPPFSEKMGGNEGGWPSAADLDAVAPHHPVYLTAKSLHAAWVNSAALKQAGITVNTPDPKDGKIQRDEAGRATGILLENAMGLVEAVLPEVSTDDLADAIEKAQSKLWRMGLTGVHDFDRRDSFMALQQLHAQGRLKLRVNKNIPLEGLEHADALGLRTGFGDDMLWIGSVKAFMDGALGPRTAAMFEPYLNEPENCGFLNMDAEQLFEHSRRAADVGLSMSVHAIGDRANHEALDAFEQLRVYETENNLPHLRHRIEHLQIVHPYDAARLGKLNVIASMQPIHATSDMLMADRFWGERSALAYAWRTQLQHGAHLAFGSDAPVESPNPFLGLHAAVTRRRADGSPGPDGWYPAQRLSVAEAVSAYTRGAAYAANTETRLGQLRPGYLADLIVLEHDPFTCPPDDLLTMQSTATMVGGEWVWQSEVP